MSVFNCTLYGALYPPPSHHSHRLLLRQLATEVNSTHPLHTLDGGSPYNIAHYQLCPRTSSEMPSVKQCSASLASAPCPVSLARQALVSLAQALVASGRLTYAELLSCNSISEVSAIVRQVRELLRVELSQWRQWMEDAAESHLDGTEAEPSSELSTPLSSASSPLSVCFLPDSPASPASSRSPSPPPDARRTLTIITRLNGKRPRPSARRPSTACSISNSTTYMTAEQFISYFQDSRSLSEAVKRITRDYPSYREVSIYARARRLQCRFDERGRFYQPSTKAKAAASARNGSNGAHSRSGRAMMEESSGQEEEEEEDEGEESEAEEASSTARQSHAARNDRHRKMRKVEWEGTRDREMNGRQLDEDGSSDDGNDVRSQPSYLSSSSSGSSSESGCSRASRLGAASVVAPAADATELHPAPSAPGGMDALQLLATSAHSSLLQPCSEASSAAPALTSRPTATATPPTERRTVPARQTVLSAPQPNLRLPAISPLVRGSAVRGQFQSLPLGVSSSVYGQLPVSPALRPVFGAPSFLRSAAYFSQPFAAPPTLSCLPLWPPLSALPVTSTAARAAFTSDHPYATPPITPRS